MKRKVSKVQGTRHKVQGTRHKAQGTRYKGKHKEGPKVREQRRSAG